MRRKRRVVLAVVAVGALGAAAWAFLRPPAVRALTADAVASAEVRFLPWGGVAAAPGSDTADPAVIAELVAVLRSGTSTGDHKCASRGVITLRQSDGRAEVLEFLPGHKPDWYELRYEGGVYRVPRAAFVNAMRRVGVAVPLEC